MSDAEPLTGEELLELQEAGRLAIVPESRRQIRRSDLKTMSPARSVKARKDGRMEDLRRAT